MDETATQAAQANTEAAKSAGATTEQQATDTTTATATTEQQAADKTAGEPAKPVVPDKYELKLPEGSLLAPSMLERISTEAREKGLSNEAAQELVDRESKAVAAHHEAQMKQVEDIRNGWAKAAEADSEIGGADFKQNIEMSRRLIEKVNPAIKPLLDETGFGNHPEVIRFMVNIVKMSGFSEDQFVHPRAQQGSTKTLEEKFYGSSTTN